MTLTPNRRLAYAFVGLLAGDAAMLLYMLLNAFMAAQVPIAIQQFVLYAVSSIVGWALVGVPVALLLPAHFVKRWPWSIVVTLGAFLGLPAMVLVLLVLDGGRPG